MPNVMIEKIATAIGSRTLPLGPISDVGAGVGGGGGGGVIVASVIVGSSRTGSAGSTGKIRAIPDAVLGCPTGPRSGVDLATAFERPAQRDLVGVLEVAADGEAAGDAGGAHAEGLQQPGQVHGGGLALDVGVGGEDHLGDALGVDSGEHLLDPQLLGPDALDR